MLSINLVVNILIGCAFVFMFLANISTAEKKRLKYVWAAVVVFVCVSGMYLFNREKISLAQMTYFVGFGAIWPQLMSRIFILHQIQSPVEYMNRRLSAGSMILGLTVLAFFSFFILMILQPNRINYVTGEAIYREEDVQFKISYLFLLLPGAITFFIFFIQRTAFCANGLLYGGLLLDWSNFRSYKWENEKLYQDANIASLIDKNSVIELTLCSDFKTVFIPAKIQFVVPYSKKETIDRILKQAFP